MPDDRSKYTITFGADDRIIVRFDCNRGRVSWSSPKPNQLRFGPLALTRAMCPTGSLQDQIARNWKFVRSYVLKDGHLFLSLMAASGIYEFEPMVLSAESASLFGKRWTLTELKGTAVKTKKAYIEFDRELKRFSGNGGCNRIAGGFEIEGRDIKFSQAISTKMACIDNEIQRLETEFLNALQAVTKFEIQGNTLRLYAGDQLFLTFSSNATANADSTQAPRLTGTITYGERIALPPNAMVKVNRDQTPCAGDE